jgi:hypothetical protein
MRDGSLGQNAGEKNKRTKCCWYREMPAAEEKREREMLVFG